MIMFRLGLAWQVAEVRKLHLVRLGLALGASIYVCYFSFLRVGGSGGG